MMGGTTYWVRVSCLPFGFEYGNIDITKRSSIPVEYPTGRG